MARIAFLNERMLRGFGVDLVIDAVASGLARRGHDVTVYASVTDDMGPRPYRLDRIPTRASRLPMRYQAAARWWADYVDAGDHDVVLIESYPFYSLIPRLRAPAIAVDHGVSSTTGMSPTQKLAFAYIKSSQNRRFFPRAAGVVTVSEFLRSSLPQRVASSARVIYNGADHYPAAESSARKKMRDRLGLRPDDVVALYIGRLNPEGQPYKGTADLMAAAAAWQREGVGIRLVMAGKGSESDPHRIREAGAIPVLDAPVEDMPGLYAAADFYLTASRWEGFDLPLAEAAFQGVPSVALRVGAHPEVVIDGQTGMLAADVPGLIRAARELAGDTAGMRQMGEAARCHAASFTWARAVDSYEEVIQEARCTPGSPVSAGAASQPESVPSQAAEGAGSASDITAIILNYGASYEVLGRCVASLMEQTHRPQVLVVDNASPRNLDVLDSVAADFPGAKILRLSRNQGFAGGMNRGVEAADTEFVVLLNNDVILEPGAVAEMRRVIDLGENVVGVAPKILLEQDRGYIDAIGNLIDGQGSAFNMGIGQLDIGQYDREEETFGACFAATLLRRKAFRRGYVGPLEERFFMYYEDVDWCFRAGLLGFKFLTAPRAVVYHAHSLTTRELDYGFKFSLIMRNFIWTAARDFQRGRWWRVCARRILGLARNVLRGPFRRGSLVAIVQTLFGLPVFIAGRAEIQGRRRVDDQTLFNYSHGEQGFFDPLAYAPMRRLEVLAAMYFRLFMISGEERHRRIAEAASALSASRLRFDRDFVRERLRPLIESEPPCVHDFVDQMT